MESRDAANPEVSVRTAVDGDAGAVCELVNTYADAGLTLRRNIAEVRQVIHEFAVAERGGEIIACGALTTVSPSVAEIRSVAAHPRAKGTGAASHVVRFLVETAVQHDLDRVVLLTKVPGFFARLGFREVAHEFLPPDFVERAIIARGRTLAGRIAMMRDPRRVVEIADLLDSPDAHRSSAAPAVPPKAAVEGKPEQRATVKC